jgi:hypothetical protein
VQYHPFTALFEPDSDTKQCHSENYKARATQCGPFSLGNISMQLPPLGLTKRVDKVMSNYDGDTIKVQMTYIFDIRITDEDGTFDMPEVKSNDPVERANGLICKDRLDELCKAAKEVVVHIPGDELGRISHYNAVGGRVAAIVFCDGKDVTTDEILSKYNKGKKKKTKK